MNAVAATPQADRDALVTEKQWSVTVPAALLEGGDDKVLTLWWNPVGHWQATHTRAAKQERVSVAVVNRETAQAATNATVNMAAVQYWADEQICRMKRVVRKLWRGSDRPRQASTQNAIAQAKVDNADITSNISASTRARGDGGGGGGGGDEDDDGDGGNKRKRKRKRDGDGDEEKSAKRDGDEEKSAKRPAVDGTAVDGWTASVFREVSGAIESWFTRSRPRVSDGRVAALMAMAGQGIPLHEAVRREQREYQRAEFVDPDTSRSFGRSHPVTKNAANFMRLLDEHAQNE